MKTSSLLKTRKLFGAMVVAVLLLFMSGSGSVVSAQGVDAATVKEWREAAERGSAWAQYNLGLMYDSGDGVAEDDEQAMKWYQKAAEQGLADAQNNLGGMYINGEGVAEDDVEAVKWFRKAAEQGNAEAQLGLGVMYANGRGVPQNEVLAHRWWNLAGAQGHTIARKNMELIANYMTKEQIADAQRMAREWQVKHSGQGEE